MGPATELGACNKARCACSLACRPRSSHTADSKVVAAAVAAYALSPIDLIPDFIPVLGYLDDVLILPIGILLAVRLIPAGLMEEFRAMAAERLERPSSTVGLIIVVALWFVAVALFLWWLWPSGVN